MSDELREKMNTWFYFLIKEAARSSYADFITERCEMTQEEYDEMRDYIQEKIGIELYL